MTIQKMLEAGVPIFETDPLRNRVDATADFAVALMQKKGLNGNEAQKVRMEILATVWQFVDQMLSQGKKYPEILDDCDKLASQEVEKKLQSWGICL